MISYAGYRSNSDGSVIGDPQNAEFTEVRFNYIGIGFYVPVYYNTVGRERESVTRYLRYVFKSKQVRMMFTPVQYLCVDTPRCPRIMFSHKIFCVQPICINFVTSGNMKTKIDSQIDISLRHTNTFCYT